MRFLLDIANINGIVCEKMLKMFAAKKHSPFSFTPVGPKMSNLNLVGKILNHSQI
jgi:hypothetical protein